MAASAFAWLGAPALLQSVQAQEPATQEQGPQAGLLGDDFARETGAIVVIGQRPGEGNLFEPVLTPDNSCLAKAPRMGARPPGFAIDASRLRRVSQLESIRRKTPAETIFVSGGSFVGADFRKAKLYNMCFFGTDLSQSDWTGASAQGMGFVDVDLTGATMAGSHLPDVLLRNTRLSLVNAAGARWMQGRLDGGWGGSLRGLDLSKADLTDFRFVCGTSAEDGCPVDRSEILMAGANLRRASLATFFAQDLDLAGARIDQTELALDHLALLEEARVAGPVVLRSARRAVMLFPAEIKRLRDTATDAGKARETCPDLPPSGEAAPASATAPGSGALSSLCAMPGSEPRDLVRSVAALETAAQGRPGYDAARQSWTVERDACLNFADADKQSNCLLSVYRSRQVELREAVGQPDWLSAPGYRLFLSREAAFPTGRDSPGLYGRILPVLLDSAIAAVIVRSDGKGRADAKGTTADGCDFAADGLFYQVGSAQLGFGTPARQVRRGRRAAAGFSPLLGTDGQAAAVIEEGLARAAPDCLPDNPFPRLEEVVLDERLLALIWDRF